jgi:hypothetical protein
MTCIKIKTKKYQTRNAPAYHAKDCKGKTKKGNNGKLYISLPDKNGVYKWVLKIKSGSKPKFPKKVKGTKTYTIIDNGDKPFVADVTSSQVMVYKQKKVQDEWVRGPQILDITYEKVFIGDNDLGLNGSPKGKYPGNSLLIKELGPSNTYIHVGKEIYSFQSRDGEEITKYYSPVGNSVSPYPYAIGENYTYFMLYKQTLPNELLNLKKDGYCQFTGLCVNDKKLKAMIESSKTKFRTKKL